MTLPLAVFRLDRLYITAPPADAFEAALGSRLEARFIGFYYWKRTLRIVDGVNTSIGDAIPWAMWHNSLGWKIHKHYCFGYEGREPDDMLVVDRASRRLYAGRMQVAHEALKQQEPRQAGTTGEEIYDLGENLQVEDSVDLLASAMPVADCESYLAKKTEGMVKLKMWLRHHPR